MFVRVKKIGATSISTSSKTPARAVAMSSASSRRSAAATRSRIRPARRPDRLRRPPFPPLHRAVQLLPRRTGGSPPPQHRPRSGVRPLGEIPVARRCCASNWPDAASASTSNAPIYLTVYTG